LVIFTPVTQWISRLLLRISTICIYLSNKISSSFTKTTQAKLWIQDKGDLTYRLNYDLNQRSIVFDLGGFEGQWASDIYAMYRSNILIFEPVDSFAQQITKRFSRNPKILVYNFGLSKENATKFISVNGNKSSLYLSSGIYQNITLKRARDFLLEHQIEKIDLMKINIEGGEYDLLEELISAGFIIHITDLQIQFHDFIPNADERMHKIQAALAETHRLTYQYKFVWENWRIK
jgi:FkbM family methyltransferase